MRIVAASNQQNVIDSIQKIIYSFQVKRMEEQDARFERLQLEFNAVTARDGRDCFSIGRLARIRGIRQDASAHESWLPIFDSPPLIAESATHPVQFGIRF